MKRKILILQSALVLLLSCHSKAQTTIGQIKGMIDNKDIDLEVRCEYVDPPGLLHARSDFEGNQQLDIDGDGLFISTSGMKTMGMLGFVFHHGEEIYKFGGKYEFGQNGATINDEFKSKDGSTYQAALTLICQ